MLFFKNTTNLSELNSLFEGSNKGVERLCETLIQFMDSRRFRSSTGIKSKGYSFSELFQFLFLFPFLGKASIYALSKCGIAGEVSAKKDAYYDLLNHPEINWRNLLFSFAKQFRTKVNKGSQSGEQNKNTPSALIIDDTLLAKTGKQIEGVSLVHDHSDRTYKLGFKALVFSYFDGKNIIPLDFSLHSESHKPKREALKKLMKKLRSNMFVKKREAYSKGTIRKKELKVKKTDNTLLMLRRAIKHGFKAPYLLVDSWFVNAELIKTVRSVAKKTMHLIGMVKQDKRKYEMDGKLYTAKAIATKLMHKKQRNKRYKLDYIKVACSYKNTPVTLYFVRVTNQSEWKALLTTNTTISFTQVFEIYQIRWSIEVMFRDCKQHLGLGVAQSNDFDAQIASVTLVLMRYITLALVLRFENYETIGELFRQSSERLTGLTLMEKIWIAIKEFILSLAVLIGADWELLMKRLARSETETNQLFDIFRKINNPQNNTVYGNT